MIKVYTTPTCTYCAKAKEFLTQNKVEFVAIDISKNPLLRDLVVENTGKMAVPAFQKGDNWLSGFNEEGLEILVNM